MIIPVRCFTCGKTIADKYDYYVTETKKLSGDNDGSAAASTSAAKKKKKIQKTQEILMKYAQDLSWISLDLHDIAVVVI